MTFSHPSPEKRKAVSAKILAKYGDCCTTCGQRLSFPPIVRGLSCPDAVFVCSDLPRNHEPRAFCPSCTTRYRVKRHGKGIYKFPKKSDLKRELFDATGGRCGYCGCALRLKPIAEGIKHPDDATIEHVLPRSRGGHSYRDNLIIACRDCNETKLSLTLPEYFRVLALVQLAVEAA